MKELKIKVSVEQPFGFEKSMAMIMGDTRFLTQKPGKAFNQIHLHQLNELFNTNADTKVTSRINQKKSGIDDLIMKDLMKKGILK